MIPCGRSCHKEFTHVLCESAFSSGLKVIAKVKVKVLVHAHTHTPTLGL